jgi:hypothetical protein
MTQAGEAARVAWARLLHLDCLEPVLVLVAPGSVLCPPGWIGILALDGTVTASVPDASLLRAVKGGLEGLTPEDAIRPEAVRPRLPEARSVLGPAGLFYPSPGLVIEDTPGVEEVTPHDLQAFVSTIAADEVEESGLLEVTASVFGSRTPDGVLAAVCSYRQWPNEVAHLCVLSIPAYRRHGHARRAAVAAIREARAHGLLPQWRARPPASRALALRLGLVELGGQLSFEPA